MNDNWTNKLRDKMADYKEPAPEGLWDDIDAAVKGAKPSSGTRRKKIIVWTARIGTIAAVIAALFLIILKDSPQTIQVIETAPSTSPAGQATAEAIIKAPTEQTGSHTDIATPTAINTITTETAAGGAVGVATGAAAEIAADTTSEVASETTIGTDTASDAGATTATGTGTSAEIAAETAENAATDTATVPPDEKNGASDQIQVIDGWNDYYADADTKKTKKGRKKLTAGIYTSNFQNSAAVSLGNDGIDNVNDPFFSSGEYSSLPVTVSDSDSYLLLPIKYNKTISQKTHNQPVRVGATVCWNFIDNLGIESGITYTYLSSKLYSGNESYHYDMKQTLHYLGIPLNLRFSFLESKVIDLYLSGGGLMEICVSGNLQSKLFINNALMSTEDERLRDEKIQWSANAFAGIQFNIVRMVGIYLEPGIGYFFDTGSNIEKIYTGKPWSFNLSLGVRVML